MRERFRALHSLTKEEGARDLYLLGRAICASMYLLVAVLLLGSVREASAQSILLGTSQTSGALIGYGISQKGTTVTVEPVGQIVASGKVGHLFGNFLGGADKELLQVRKIRNDTFAFIATKPDGTRLTRRVRLSQDVGDLFYLLTAFDTNGNGTHGVAIIDVSEHHYRWHIIEDPLSRSMRVDRPFRLGFYGERIDWVSSPDGGIEFVALRQTINTRRTRALLRNASTGATRVFRSIWDSPSGLLIPVRLQAGSKRDPGVALYAPAKREILLFDGSGGFEVFALPEQRCAGYQAVTNLSRSGAVSTIEVCSDGSYLIVQREEEQRGQPNQESIIGSGTLPEALGNLRRGDATVVQETIGEISIPIAAPGSSGAEVIQPITQPLLPPATSTPKPQATATETPTPTATSTLTHTPTATPIPTPMVFSIDTTQTSTGSTGANQFKLPLVPGGAYSFTVYWGDGTQDFITSYEDSGATHTYSSAGTYTVSIYGQLHGWRFDNTGDRLKLLDISQWGNGFRFANVNSLAIRHKLNASEEKIEALVAHGGYIWAGTATTPGKIIKFDPNTGTYISTALASDETSIYGMTTDGSFIYATDRDSSSRIIKIDPATGARVAGYETGVGYLFSMTFDGTYVWAGTNSVAPKLVRFNPADNSVAVYDLTGAGGSWSIVSAGDFIFGVNGTKLYRFNKSTTTVDIVTISGASAVEGLAFDGTNIWATTEQYPAKILKFNPTSLTYEIFSAPATANSSEGMIYDGEYLWATIKNAETAALLKIPPSDPNAATIVPLAIDAARVNALVQDGNTIWAANLEPPASLYKVSKAAWPSDSFFYGCANMTISAADTPDMTGVTSMRNAFRECIEFNSDIGNWDVSAVTDFGGTFYNALSFNNGGGLGVTHYYHYLQTETAKLWLSSGIYNGGKLKAIQPTDESLVYYFHGQTLVDSVASSSGKIKISYGADFPNLTKVRFTTTGTLPGGLSAGTDYYLIRQSYNSTSDMRPAALVAASLADAQAGTAITYVNVGTGTHTMIRADDSGWTAGQPRTQYWTTHYDDGTTVKPVATNYYSVRWLYRELSPTSKKIFYVAGTGQYATTADALLEPQRNDLPSAVTSNSVLVAKLLIQPGGLRPVVVPLIEQDGYYGGSDSIKNWNVSNAKTMRHAFRQAASFNVPLAWNLSGVTNFEGTFHHARSFNQNLSGWNVSSAVNFNSMFEGAEAFNNGDLVGNGSSPLTFNPVSGQDFEDMFNCAFKFNQNVSSWDMRNALKVGGMFAYGIFNNGDPTNAQSKPLSWYLPKATKVDYVFYGDVSFNQDIGSWFAPQNGDVMQVQNISALVGQISSGMLFNNGGSPSINNWRTPNATTMESLFRACPNFNQPVNDWDVSNVTNFTSVFYGATAFNQPLSNWNTSKATTLATMFFNAGAFNQDLSAWNTGNVTSMTSMFSGASSFNNGDSGDNSAKPLPWDVSKVTNLSSMFLGATSFNQDLSTWNVSAATTLASMFSGASKFNSYIGGWNPASATTFASMFLNAAAFNNGDPAGVSTKPLAWSNTGAVTTLASMFSGARRFNQSLSSFNTSNVTSLASTFVSANSFNQDIGAWDVSKVTSFNATFNGAASLKRDLSAWNVSAGTDFTNMFASTDINTPGTTDNYDNLLLSLANVTTQNSRSLSGGSARYSYTGLGDATAGTGRAHLTAATSASPTPGHAWSISDGGNANCTFSSSSGLLVTCVGDRPSFTRVVFKTNGTLPTGITAGTTYWTVRVSGTTSRLATSLANAQASTVIPFTDSGSGTHAMMNLGHTFTASNSSGSLLLTLGTGGDLNFSGRRVRFVTTATLPTGVSTNTDYRLNRVSATTYRVMLDTADAVTSTNPIAFTDSGSGTHELILQ